MLGYVGRFLPPPTNYDKGHTEGYLQLQFNNYPTVNKWGQVPNIEVFDRDGNGC